MAGDRERWDERYRAALTPGLQRSAAAWVRAHDALLEAQPRGRALDIACGEGRNTLHLARLGFTVDAVDASGVAIEHLREVARGLPVHARRLDLPDDPLPGGDYRVVVNTYYLERALFGPMAEALAPGGLLLFETFLPDRDAEYGPQSPERVLEPEELREAFPSLEVVEYREGPDEPGTRAVASLVARRPDSI